MFISFILGSITGFALAHPTVRQWLADRFTQLKAAIRAKMGSK